MARDVLITPEKTEKWIVGYLRKRHPECEADFRKAWDAFLRCLENRTVDGEDLAIIVDAAKSKRAILWNNAVGWLRQLVADQVNVQNEVRKMASDRISQVRFSGMCSVGMRSPRQFQLDVLLAGINDRSSRVRWITINSLSIYGISEAIPLIIERRAVEKNAKVNRVIDFELPLLMHGFLAEPVSGGIKLSVRGFGVVVSRIVPQKEVDSRGLTALVKQQQEKLEKEAIVLRYVPKPE